MDNLHSIKVFAGTQSKELGQKIANNLGVSLGEVEIDNFTDGEFKPRLLESVRGSIVFIVQSTNQPTDNLMELLLLVDAAKRASAYKVVCVVPYFGWARQERKTSPREAIGTKLVTKMIETSGADRVMTMDLHTGAIQGFFDIPVDHLYGSKILVPYIESLNLENLVIASPDMGGSKRAKAYSDYLKTDMVICYKQRSKANEIGDYKVIGDIEGKNLIIVDDMIDTAGTICTSSKMMIEKGAKSVRVIASHGLFSGSAIERIEKSKISEVIVTDSIPNVKSQGKIKVLTMTDLFAHVINKVYRNEPISSTFIDSKN
jgi:ribose-phosphate pyrophosphokinase